jgi:serine acetyltransferase
MFYSASKQTGFTFSERNKICERKDILIGNDVYIGGNVMVLDGVKIGDGAVIGAGSVVSKDIPPYAVAVGAPIKIIRYRFSDEQISKLLKIAWWEFEEEKLKDVENLFWETDDFIDKYDK